MNKFKFLHYHIFKNGGTTIDWILKKNFGKSFEEIHTPSVNGYIYSDFINDYFDKQPNIIALSSHHFRPPFPLSDKNNYIEICFLRHPIDRLNSMYSFYNRSKINDDISTQKAKELSLSEYIDWIMETKHYIAINSQTCLFSKSGAFYYPPSNLDLEYAIQTIENVKFLGVVEFFDESMVAAEYFLKPVFPKIDLSYIPQNIDKSRKQNLKDRIKIFRKKCGEKKFSQIKKNNKLDEILVEHATKELERRISYIPNFNQKLNEFKDRCKCLV